MTTLLQDSAAVVAQIGDTGFGAAVMQLLHRQCGADLCSVFTVTGGQPAILIAESHDRRASPFARIASLRYVQRFWRHDIAALSTLGRAHRSVQVLRRPARGIRDLEYQRECYDEGAVTERLSLYRAGPVTIIANAYRARPSGPFGADDCDAFAALADLLHAAALRHAQLIAPTAPQRLTGRPGPGLSHREAQIAEMTAAGLELPQIAAELGLKPSSVTTYRRRAYQKLGVANRHQLRDRIGS